MVNNRFITKFFVAVLIFIIVGGCDLVSTRRIRTGLPHGRHREVSWSPNGQKLLFLHGSGGEDEIYEWSLETGESVAITRWSKRPISGQRYIIMTPRWLFNDKITAFREPTPTMRMFYDNKHELVIIDEENEVNSLIWVGGLPIDLCWGPNGDQALIISLVTQRSASTVITTTHAFMYDLYTGLLQDIIIPKEDRFSRCAWQKNGDQIAIYGDDAFGKIGIMNPDTMDLKWLKSFDESFTSGNKGLAWSPSGKWLAFHGLRRPRGRYDYGIYMMNVEDPDLIEKIYTGPVTADLHWSPDGQWLAVPTIGTPGSNEIILIEVPEQFR